ncbi:MAG: hypothetical protein K2K57_01650 [Oscillospiraceae bacterium]|nr:hypothetical protein [Oscillospiraceae bacterium]
MTKIISAINLCGEFKLTVKSNDNNWYRLYLTEIRKMDRNRKEKIEIYLGAEVGKIITERFSAAVNSIIEEKPLKYSSVDGKNLHYVLALSETYTSIFISEPPQRMLYFVSRDYFAAEQTPECDHSKLTLPYIVRMPFSVSELSQLIEDLKSRQIIKTSVP